MDGFWDLVGIKDGPLSKNLAVKYHLGITDTPNYSSGYSEQAKNFVSN